MIPTSQPGSPRVTVAIPVFNSASTLERAMRSAMRQTLADIEILVTDDGSTDGSHILAERLAREDARIQVFRVAINAGKSAAMNAMVAAARGDWVAVLDADDAFGDTRLQTLVDAAEARGADLVADNIVYVDGDADTVVRTAFDPATPDRAVGLAEFWAHSHPHAEFDFGILKPVIRRAFLLDHAQAYYPTALSEDFYYLMNAFLAGARGLLVGQPLYFWTMPFGPLSRTWTGTGNGAWRYDYRQASKANGHFIDQARARGDGQTVAQLTERSRQYRVMQHYLDAQKALAQGHWARCVGIIATHPTTYGLLARRVTGRLARLLRRPAASAAGAAVLPHPSLRA